MTTQYAPWVPYPPPPPPRRRNRVKVVATVAITLASVGLLALAFIGLHGSGNYTYQPAQTQPTQTTEPAPYEQAYLNELHAISARVPAMSWGRSNSELLREGYVACADLDASPGRNPYQAYQDVQAWGGWPYNPNPVVISPAPGSEDQQPPIILPGRTASAQAGELVQMAEAHLCHQTV